MALGQCAWQDANSDSELSESLRKFLMQKYSTAETMLRRADLEIRYYAAFIDLNDDGKKEAIVHLVGTPMCGSGGCTTLVLKPEGEGFKIVGDIVAASAPIRVLQKSSHGWRSLSATAGGGGKPFYEAEFPFDGKAYPESPNIPPARPLDEKEDSGNVVIPDKPYSDATLLLPRP
ncbi:MAG: hypothetical protein HY313_03885 [Acidobacteria bacterium]|nr:hypothetical protein [Acidobacteriota bacterium]